jgi:hypothetical protein
MGCFVAALLAMTMKIGFKRVDDKNRVQFGGKILKTNEVGCSVGPNGPGT